MADKRWVKQTYNANADGFMYRGRQRLTYRDQIGRALAKVVSLKPTSLHEVGFECGASKASMLGS